MPYTVPVWVYSVLRTTPQPRLAPPIRSTSYGVPVRPTTSDSPMVKARESPNRSTLTGAPVYWGPRGTGMLTAASAAVGRVAATVTATTARKAPEVTSQARHSVRVRIRPRRTGSSTR